MIRIFSAVFVAFCGFFIPTFAHSNGTQNGSQNVAPTEDWRAQTWRQIEQLKQALAKKPNLVSYYKLGGLYDLLGRWDEAIAAYSQGLTLQPNHADSHLVLGWCYAKLNRYEEALVSHQRAADLKPNDVAAVFAVGWDQFCLKRYDDAVIAYQKVLAREPKDAGAYYELARVYLAQGKREAALEQLQRVERHDKELAALLQRELERMTPPPVSSEKNAPAAASQPPPATSIRTAAASLKPKILQVSKAKYTEAARRDRVSGVVVISAVFTADGRITNLRVARGLPMGLAECAIKAAEQIRFEPAQKEGKPVSVRMSIEFAFNLL